MTIRLDLRKRPDAAIPGHTTYEPKPYGCADCGRWFYHADGPDGLGAHICHERGIAHILEHQEADDGR